MASLEPRRIGDLDCHVITCESHEQSLELTAIFCHGYGAPGDDLVPVGAQLLQQFPDLLDHIQMIFPAAPIDLSNQGLPGGRAWWPLEIDQLTRAVQQRNFDELRKSCPPLLPAAREKLMRLIKEIGQPPHKIVLGGFSQGAMLATDVALHLPEPPACLVIWSGTLLNEEEWRSRAPCLKDVPIIQSHGRDDPILPYEAAIWLKDLFVAAECKVNFIGFRGPHTISKDAINAVGELIERSLGFLE